MAKLEGSPRRPGGVHGREVTMAKLEGSLEGFLAGRRDRDAG